jgi:hypothetical protein
MADLYYYKGQQLTFAQLKKKTNMKTRQLLLAFANNSLDKAIISPNGNIDYIDYGITLPILIKKNTPENFKKNLRKDIIFSNKVKMVKTGRRGINKFIVAPNDKSLEEFDDIDLKFKVNSISWVIAFYFYNGDTEPERRQLKLDVDPENDRLNKQDILNLILNESRIYINRFMSDRDLYLRNNEEDENPLKVYEAIKVIKINDEKEEKVIASEAFIETVNIVEDKRDEDKPRTIINNANEYFIRLEEPLKIDNIKFYNCEVFEYPNEDKINCLINYLKCHFVQKKYYLNLNSETPTLEDFINFIKSNEYQEAYLFDINGKLLFKQEKKKVDKRTIKNNYKHIYAIIHNNHIYGLKPCTNHNIIKKLDKKEDEYNKTTVFDTIDAFYEKISDIIKNDKTEPKFINGSCFIHNKERFIQNNEVKEIDKLYKKLGIQPDYFLTKGTIYKDLYKLYNIDYSSYFPYNYKQSGFMYRSDVKYKKDDLICVDKNKCYASALARLDYIITCNIIYNEPQKYNNEDIIEHYLYVINTDKPTNLIPDLYMIVSGKYINYIKKHSNKSVVLNILEYIPTTKHENKFTQMIENVYSKITNKYVKNVFNIMIGKLQKTGTELLQTRSNYRVMTNEASNFENAKYYPLDEDYNLVYDLEVKEINYAISNNLPLSYQIIEESRIMINDKMIEMGVDEKDIVQIKTDGIVLKNKDKYKKRFKHEPKNLYGWKDEDDYDLLTSEQLYRTEKLTFFLESKEDNEIYNALAGGGKSYTIENVKAPQFGDDYIITAFKHTTLEGYRKNKLKCNTIDHYMFSGKIPSEKHIIVDEFALLRKEHFDYLLKLYYRYNKKLYLYGDIRQLEAPFNNENGFITKNFLKYFSKIYSEDWTNMRNHFKASFYEKLINKYNDMELIKYCLDKYTSNDYTNVDMCIAYRKDNVDKLNQKVLEAKHLTYDEENKIVSAGVKVINTTNYLKCGDYEFYNQQRFIIVKQKGDEVIIKDMEDNKYTISIDTLFENFKLNYAQTLYASQGSSYESFYFDPSDIHFLKTKKNALYVLISRLKNKYIN